MSDTSSTSQNHECCFVWGPPLSGQRYWMTRAAEDTSPEEARVSLLPLEDEILGGDLEKRLKVLESLFEQMARDSASTPQHIYFELPWNVVQEGQLLEDWLATRPEFQSGWNVSFVCVCPPDADRLPASYREAMEEFVRATESAVIVVRREGDESEIEWLGTEKLDFGKKVEIFEEDLWPASLEAEVQPTHALKDTPEMEILTLSVSGDSTSFVDLFQDLVRGYYGPLWGAEAYWRNARGEQEALTITQGQLFSWTSEIPALVASAPMNGALLNLVGMRLRRQDLILALRSQSFC